MNKRHTSRETLIGCYERQRRSLRWDPVPRQKGIAFPVIKGSSGLWVAWDLDESTSIAASLPVRQALTRVLPAALYERYRPEDADIDVDTVLRQGFNVTEIRTAIDPASVAGELATVMAVDYMPIEKIQHPSAASVIPT